jgi:hypothetical protein
MSRRLRYVEVGLAGGAIGFFAGGGPGVLIGLLTGLFLAHFLLMRGVLK